MFDYARNMKLALADTARRTAIKAVAGVVAALGLGFLLAALWSFLASPAYMGWGPMYASLAIGGGFILIALIALMMSRKVKHEPPTVDDLKGEVSARLDLAMSRAADAAEKRVQNFTDRAEQKVAGLVDSVGFRANDLASRAERKAETLTREATESVVRSSGMTPEMANALGRFGERAAILPPLVGAFVVGLNLASRFQDWRASDEDDDYDDEDWYEDDYAYEDGEVDYRA